MPTLPSPGRLALLVLTAALLIAACRTAAPPPNPLAGTAWELRTLVQGSDSLTAAGGLPADQVRFQPDSGVRIRSCNTCTGTYRFSDRHVVTERLACTRRACPAGRLELDRYVAGRAAYRLRGDWLILDIDDDLNGIEARLYFAPVIE